MKKSTGQDAPASSGAMTDDVVREFADEIAKAAISHLQIQYPAALASVPASAQVSLRNFIKAQVISRFSHFIEKPL